MTAATRSGSRISVTENRAGFRRDTLGESYPEPVVFLGTKASHLLTLGRAL